MRYNFGKIECKEGHGGSLKARFCIFNQHNRRRKMGMRLISTLKSAKYAGTALVLLFAATPVSPIATWIAGSDNAMAATQCDSTNRNALNSNLTDNKSAATLCNNITDDNEIRLTKSASVDLNGYTLGVNLRVSANNAKIIIEDTSDNKTGRYTGSLSVGRNGGTFAIRGGTYNFNPTNYVDQGYEAVRNTGGTWTVKKAIPTTTVEKWLDLDEAADGRIDFEKPETYASVVATSSDENIITTYDSTTNIYYIVRHQVGDATMTYEYKDSANEVIAKVIATIHVYDIIDEEEVVMMEGTTVSLNDAAFGSFTHPEMVRAEMLDEVEESTYVEGSNITNTSFTAGHEFNAYMIDLYAGEEDLGRLTIRVFPKQMVDQVMTLEGDDSEKTIEIETSNFPMDYAYRFVSSDESVVSVTSDSDNDTFTLKAEGAGKATVSVLYFGDDLYGEPSETFTVTVSDFQSDAQRRYTASGGDTVEFTVSEGAGQDYVTCEVDGVACSASEEFTVSRDDNGKYSILVNENAKGGAHTFTFKDTLIDEEVTVEIYVYEIVLDQTEYYLNVNTMQQFTVQERNNNGSIRVAVTDAAGGRVNDANVYCQRQSQGSAVYNCALMARRAGQYTIRVRSQNRQGSRVYDTEYITLYAIDFTVNDTAYHMKKGDSSTTDKLINTLNNYWEETAHGEATGFEILKADNTKYYGTWKDAEAGKYAVEFYAFAGPDRFDLENRVPRDTKTVDLYVYEMTVPEDSEYRGEAGDTFTGIDVNDKINVTVPETATITAEVTYGDASAVDLSEIMDGKVTISKPGRYEVTYTDTMANGGVVDTWTATFKVYDLDAIIPDGTVLNLNAGDKFTYTINPSGTYGLVRTTVKRTGTKGGRAQEVYSGEHRYHGSAETETETEFTFDPAEYGGEGKYTVKMKNLSAEDFGEEVEGTFYAVAKEFELKAVKQGTVVKTTSGSKWSVDGVYINGEDASDQLDGKTLEINTTNLPLGVNIINFVHDFDGQEVLLKSMSLVVYKVVPDKKTDPERITEDTIESLIDALMSPVIDKEAEAKIKAILGEDYLWPSMGLWMSMVEGQEIDTRVQVTDLSEDKVEAEMIEAVDALGADHVDYYDVSVLMEVNGVEIGKLHKLNGKLTVALAEVTDPASGYTRQYFVLRDHNGVVTTLTEGVDFYIEDGILYVISDEFSTYAVAYKDTLLPVPKAPDTGDEVVAEGDTASVSISTAVVLAAAAITLVGAVVFAKRK